MAIFNVNGSTGGTLSGTASGDTFIVTSPTVFVPGDLIDGLGGVDAVAILGNGANDFRVTNVEVVNASTSANSDDTVTVEAASPNMSFNLRSGNDTVNLTQGSTINVFNVETVNGSSAVDMVRMGTSGTITLNEVETFRGTMGDDVINYSLAAGHGAGQFINGNGGNDVLNLLSASSGALRVAHVDTINGSAGDDFIALVSTNPTVTISGVEAVLGGATDDTITITGSTGALVNSKDGKDVLVGGTGSDRLNAGDGDDTVTYDAADSQVTGGNGVDNLIVNATGGITVNLGAGDQVLGGSSSVSGFENVDASGSTGGIVTIFGDGLPGGNVLIGSGGTDVIDGRGGNDVISAGGGNDRVFYDASDVSIDGGANANAAGDILVVSGPGSVIIDLNNATDQTLSDSAVVTNFERIDASTNSGGVNIFGTDDANVLTGGFGADVLVGQGGNDVVVGGIGADVLDGGSGNDVIGLSNTTTSAAGGVDDGGSSMNARGQFGDSAVLAFGNTINNIDLNNSPQNNTGTTTLSGFESIDGRNDTLGLTLRGTAGSNSLIGGIAGDTIRGRGGDDTIEGYFGNDDLGGGAGNDTIFGGDDPNATAALGQNGVSSGNDTINGDAGDDMLYGQDGEDTINGGADNDTIEGGTGDDDLRGDGGNDTVYGGGSGPGEDVGTGDDDIRGGGGMDMLFGQDGEDDIRGGADNDMVDGGDGDDTLRGGSGDDTILGGAGDDDIIIDNVSDLTGGPGTETIDGGADYDQLFINSGGSISASDLSQTTNVEEFVTNNGSTLNIGLNDSNSGLFSSIGGDLLITATGGSDDLNVNASGVSSGNGSLTVNLQATRPAIDMITGTQNDDLVQFSRGELGLADTVDGQGGNDVIELVTNGMNVNANVNGVSNVETIRTVNTNPGTSGEVVDVTFAAGYAQSMIEVDASDLDASDSLVLFTVNNSAGEDVMATGGAGADFFFGGAGVETINAGDGADALVGLGGADVLNGEGGNDDIEGGAGADTIDGGDGDDSIFYSNRGDYDDDLSVEGGGNNAVDFSAGPNGSAIAIGDEVVFDFDDTPDGTADFGPSDLAKLSGIETITLESVSGSPSVVLDDAFFASNGEGGQVLIRDQGTSFSNVTVDASAVTAGSVVVETESVVDVDTLIGGAGDDIFRFSNAFGGGFDAADTVIGGLGNDTIEVGEGTSSVLDTNISGIEQLVVNQLNFNNVPLPLTPTVTNVTLTSAFVQNGLTVDGTQLGAGPGGSPGEQLIVDASANDATEQITILGGGGFDTLTAGDSADTIDGGDGNDVIRGNGGNDTLSGGDGDDRFLASGADFIVGGETVDGGDGFDVLEFDGPSSSGPGYFFNIGAFTGLSNVEEIAFTAATDDQLIVSDALFADNPGSGSFFRFDSSAAAGTLNVDASAVTSQNIEFVANTVAGEDDVLLGGGGNDVFVFSGMNGLETGDTLDGGLGSNIIRLDNGAGDVMAMIDGGVTNVSEILVNDASPTTDIDGDVSIIIGSGYVNGDLLVDASSLDDLASGLPALAETLTFTADTALTDVFTVLGGAGGDAISGAAADDVLEGGAGDDTLLGFDGEDTMNGGAGDDTIGIPGIGSGGGIDTIFAGTGADMVFGGAGGDLIDLGADADMDQVLYTSANQGAPSGIVAGFDVVTNFVSGDDKFVIDGTLETALDDDPNDDVLTFDTDGIADFRGGAAGDDEAAIFDVSGFASGLVTDLNAVLLAVQGNVRSNSNGNDGLIVATNGVDQSAVYVFEESNGINNNVGTSELTLLATFDDVLSATDFMVA